MKKIAKKICFATFVFLFCFMLTEIFTNVSPAQSLMDRLVVKIDKNRYTQSDVEYYLQIKNHLNNYNNKTLAAFNVKDRWSKKLDEFLYDMVLYNEALTNTSESLSKVSISELIDSLIEYYKTKNVQFEFNNERCKKILRTILTIERFIKTRKSKIPNGVSVYDSEWLKSLLKSHEYRYYDGAQKYHELSK